MERSKEISICSQSHTENIKQFCKNCNIFFCPNCMEGHSAHDRERAQIACKEIIEQYDHYLTQIKSWTHKKKEMMSQFEVAYNSLIVEIQLFKESFLKQYCSQLSQDNEYLGHLHQTKKDLKTFITKGNDAINGAEFSQFYKLLPYQDSEALKDLTNKFNKPEENLKDYSIELNFTPERIKDHFIITQNIAPFIHYFERDLFLVFPTKRTRCKIKLNGEIPDEHSSIQLNSEIYITGGLKDMEYSKATLKLSLLKDNLIEVGEMNSCKKLHGIAGIKNRIYTCGGYSGEGYLSVCETYNMHANEWTYIPNLNHPRSRLRLVSTHNYMLFAIGGNNGARSSIIEQYQIHKSPHWNLINIQHPQWKPVDYTAAVQLNPDFFIIFGGFNNSGPTNAAFIFNILNHTLLSIPDLPVKDGFFQRFDVLNTDQFVYAISYTEDILFSFHIKNQDWKYDKTNLFSTDLHLF